MVPTLSAGSQLLYQTLYLILSCSILETNLLSTVTYSVSVLVVTTLDAGVHKWSLCSKSSNNVDIFLGLVALLIVKVKDNIKFRVFIFSDVKWPSLRVNKECTFYF